MYHARREDSIERLERRIGALTPLESVGRAVLAADDKQAKNIVVIDVGPFLSITDHFVVCSAQSERQVKTIAEEVERKLAEAGVKPSRHEGTADGGWILIDYGDFVVHVFTDEMRDFYDLERLWKDAGRPEIPELVEVRQAQA